MDVSGKIVPYPRMRVFTQRRGAGRKLRDIYRGLQGRSPGWLRLSMQVVTSFALSRWDARYGRPTAAFSALGRPYEQEDQILSPGAEV